MENKVRFGLENAHYAPIDEGADGTLTFGTPIPLPGSVSISLDPQGDPLEFYADNGLYYSEDTNNGYDGDLELAEIPDQFTQDILGDELIDGVLYENKDKQGKKFALLFEFKGDKKARRHVMYYCAASRPKIEGKTTEDKKDVQTSTLSFRSRPHPTTHLVKAKSTADMANYDNWYTSVQEKPNAVSSTGVTVNPVTAGLNVGGTLQLNSAVSPANATNKSVTYTSSDNAIATVNAFGLVTAVAAGTATITVTSVDGAFTDTCVVTVS
jgi:phi13 family phage major tail protein